VSEKGVEMIEFAGATLTEKNWKALIHGQLRNPDGTKEPAETLWTCPHNHKSRGLAIACARKEIDQRAKKT
jgi:hypothetical protein